MKKIKIPQRKLQEMEVTQFASLVGLKIGLRAKSFITRNSIRTVGELLNTSVTHEKSTIWRSLAGLRLALKTIIPDEQNDRYRFLIIPI